ncbi:MAG: BtaA family protein [Rhodocyclaceae bacterium]|nr:BtaA family protein [Rhodocyclaceae bacterium]
MNAPLPLEISQLALNLTLKDRIDQKIFDALYSRSLVYNTCWEDPAVDRQALDLGPDDSVLVITSAGCNALDYALQGPRKIYTVDANPRQTALLELKIAGIKKLPFDDFFALFGSGFHPDIRNIYFEKLRTELSAFAQRYWDRRISWFCSDHGSFYFHGLAGFVARGFRSYFRLRPQLARPISALFAAENLESQREIYDNHVAGELWTPVINWVLNRQLTMSLLGVPHPQRRLVQKQHPDGVAGFIREAIEYVFRHLPVRDNYFWRVYLTGSYTRECCPAYLKKAGFDALKAGLVDCIEPHTCTVTEFLEAGHEPITRFVLLDHMDWMSCYYPAALIEEWNAILERAAPSARLLLRSAHAHPPFLDWLRVGPKRQRLEDVLHFDDELAARLQQEDRVHTYAGFIIAHLKSSAND